MEKRYFRVTRDVLGWVLLEPLGCHLDSMRSSLEYRMAMSQLRTRLALAMIRGCPFFERSACRCQSPRFGQFSPFHWGSSNTGIVQCNATGSSDLLSEFEFNSASSAGLAGGSRTWLVVRSLSTRRNCSRREKHTEKIEPDWQQRVYRQHSHQRAIRRWGRSRFC